MRVIYLVLFLFIFVSFSKKDIIPSTNQLFSSHVDYHGLTPKLLRRATALYIDQFDPYKIYLLQEEIAPFVNMSRSQLQSVTDQIKKGHFAHFEKLFTLFRETTIRSSQLRQEVEREYLKYGDEVSVEPFGVYAHFAKTPVQLQERLRSCLFATAREEKRILKLPFFSQEQRGQLCSFFEKKMNQAERAYQKKKEDFFAMGVAKAIASSLDAHSAIFTPQEADELRLLLQKDYVGVGIVMRETIEGITIVKLVEGSAKESKQVEVGDIILAIDGKSMLGVHFEEVAQALKGEAGKRVTLFLRSKMGEEKRVTLTRSPLVLDNHYLQSEYIPFADGGIAFCTLNTFYGGKNRSAASDLRMALKNFEKKGPLYGVILDLRNNQGGFLLQAVEVAGIFLPGKGITFLREAKQEMRYFQQSGGKFSYEGPLFLLTSKMTASAAEIVAAAMQDYGVGLVIGDEATFGKGTAQYQTVTKQGAKDLYKVTIGRYYTDSGRSVQLDGVKADLVVPTPLAKQALGERYLRYPLPSDHLAQMNKEWSSPFKARLQNHLPLLKRNSASRLEKNREAKAYLTAIQENSKWEGPDVLRDEAIAIMQDLLIQKLR